MMYCGNCGTQLNDDAIFCLSCGMRTQPEEAPSVTPAQKETAPNRKPILIVAIIVICVLIAIIAGISAFSQMQKNERTHASVPIPITINFTTEGPNDPIGVPILIQGTDLDNNHVEQRYLSPASGGTTELKAGSYTVSVAGPTPSMSGQVYKEQGQNSYMLEVPVPAESDDDQAQESEEPDIDFTFASVPPQDLTEEDIDDMEKWTREFDVDPNEAGAAIDAVTNARDKELARIRLEQERQAALNANPSVLTGNGTDHISGVTLTGTVKIGTFYGKSNSVKDIVYLQLPSKISAQNVWYRAFTTHLTSVEPTDLIELDDSFSSYIGKTVSISGDIAMYFTRGPSCSWFTFENASVTRVFE